METLMFTKRFYRKFRNAQTFEAWIKTLTAFNSELIKENKLQMWTMADYKKYWDTNKQQRSQI